MIYIIFAGIICASIYAYYSRKVLGSFIRKLDENGLDSAEKSASLRDLGYSKPHAFLVALSLGDSSSLSKYVRSVYSADEVAVLREKGGFQKYFLPVENRELALKRYDSGKMKLWKLLCGIAACIVVAVVCANLFPYVISMVTGVGESFNTDDSVMGTRVEETVRSETE